MTEQLSMADRLRAAAAPTCPECKRRFDLRNPLDADEWAFGHDCEETP